MNNLLAKWAVKFRLHHYNLHSIVQPCTHNKYYTANCVYSIMLVYKFIEYMYLTSTPALHKKQNEYDKRYNRK